MIPMLFTDVSSEFRRLFEIERCKLNYYRIYITVRFLVGISFVMLLFALITKDSVTIQVVNGGLFGLNLTYLYFYREKPESYERKPRYLYLNFLFYLTLLLWGVIITGFNTDRKILYVDLAIVMVIPAFQYIAHMKELILLYFIGFITLLFMTPYAHASSESLLYVFTMLLLVISSFFLSRLQYRQFYERVVLMKALQDRLDESEKRTVLDIIHTLTQVLEIYDIYTKGHSEKVSYYAVKIAEEMQASKEQIFNLELCGAVHDIGKIKIPKRVLNKPSRLTEVEFELIRKHSAFGYELLSNSESLIDIRNIVRSHHECWDGTGYPDGLSEHQIPFEAQVLHVADAWDAMTSDRVYKKAKTKEEALMELNRLKGKQFSPEVVEALIRIIKREPNIR